MKVKAIDSFTYASTPHIIGDEFDMPDKDAKLLSECISPRVVILETKAEPPPAKLETVEMKAEDPPSEVRSVRSRKYMRRDMTPQE